MPSRPCVPGSFLVALLAVTISQSACDVEVRDGKTSFGLNAPQARQQWDRRYPISRGGQVEVVNLNGPIEVSVGGADSIEVHAVITAKALTEATAKEILSKGRIDETISPARIKIETVVPRGVHGSYEVRYEVRVPVDAHAELSTTNGSVKADGLGGKLKASVVNGAIDLANLSGAVDAVGVNGHLSAKLAQVAAPVRLETTNGPLTLELPATSKANLSARAVNGALSVAGLSVESPTGRRIRSLETALNGGGPAIDLRTTNGRIDIFGMPR